MADYHISVPGYAPVSVTLNRTVTLSQVVPDGVKAILVSDEVKEFRDLPPKAKHPQRPSDFITEVAYNSHHSPDRYVHWVECAARQCGVPRHRSTCHYETKTFNRLFVLVACGGHAGVDCAVSYALA